MNQEIPKNFHETCKKYNSLFFIHIPKASGKYILQGALKDELQKKVYYVPHPVCTSKPIKVKGFYNRAWDDVCTNKDSFKKSLPFSVVRNPFDYLVSCYFYGFPYFRRKPLQEMWRHSINRYKTQKDKRITDILLLATSLLLSIFRRAKERLQSNVSKFNFNSFEEFVRAYCNPEYPWLVKQQQKFLFFQLFDDSGYCCSKYVIRSECLQEGLDVLCEPFGIKVKKTNKRINASRDDAQRDFKQYYTKELRELVKKKCKRELEAFGYSFDGHDKRIIIDTENIKYNPHTDEFKLNL